jgi:putative transposase
MDGVNYKTLAKWDTTFTNSLGDVVLDIQDIHDVGKCLGILF